MEENKKYMFIIRPDDFLTLYIRTFEDIVENRDLIFSSHLTQESISYFIKMIYEYYKKLRRKRNVLVTQIIHRIMKQFKNISNNGTNTLDSETIDRLFFLFQQIIKVHFKEEWRLSIFIKDCVLRDEQIQWLLEHSSEDEKILNRILRYPAKNEKITKWCKSYLDLEGENLNRCPEYLGKIYDSLESFEILYKSKKYSTKSIIKSLKYCYLNNDSIKDCLDFLLMQESKNFLISEYALEFGLREIIVKQYEINKS